MPRRDPAAPLTERRIVLHGVTGSGKSTAATRVAEAAGLPLILVDEVAWQPGWVMVEVDEQRRTFDEITAAPCWVLDTAHGSWRDLVVARAELVIGLDYPRWLSLGRLVRRTAGRVTRRTTVCNGNTETLRQVLSSDSILRWHVRSFTRKQTQMRAWAAATEGPPVLLFARPAQLDAWLADVAVR